MHVWGPSVRLLARAARRLNRFAARLLDRRQECPLPWLLRREHGRAVSEVVEASFAELLDRQIRLISLQIGLGVVPTVLF